MRSEGKRASCGLEVGSRAVNVPFATLGSLLAASLSSAVGGRLLPEVQRQGRPRLDARGAADAHAEAARGQRERGDVERAQERCVQDGMRFCERGCHLSRKKHRNVSEVSG